MDGLLLVALLLVLVVVPAALIVAARMGGSKPPSLAPPPIPSPVQERIRAFLAANPKRRIQAIKMLRDEIPGLPLQQAKNAVDWLATTGTPLPGGHHGGVDSAGMDLASRVRRLKAAGRMEQAVFLVRGETGMDQEDAETFVASL